MDTDTPEQLPAPASKKAKTNESALSQALIISRAKATGGPALARTTTQIATELVAFEQKRLAMDVNPLYLKRLQDRHEVGFRRNVGSKRFEILMMEINVGEFRRCLSDVLYAALSVRYSNQAILKNSEIIAELGEIVPYTVDMCMAALYAKLRSLHKSYVKHASRYSTAPCYTKEIELPLPFALAIQDFGSFETHSMMTNYVIVPTFPEGTEHEGRQESTFHMTAYQSYVPTLKELGIPCKSIDPRQKLGSAWWTYKVKNEHLTSDLVCIIPPSHYTDHSAILRSVFLAPTNADSAECRDFIQHPRDATDYGTKLREMPPGSHIRSFLALCHGLEEEWSFGTS